MLAAIGCRSSAGQLTVEAQGQMAPVSRTSIVERTGLFLMAGDYRRALEACEQAIQERPSAEAYLQLTYVYQAIDAYLDSSPGTRAGWPSNNCI
ncbi:MAG: hypothetical protein IPM88_02075 [Nitrospira sp.]|nr:hypothetical protein [Nitrospira sp.]